MNIANVSWVRQEMPDGTLSAPIKQIVFERNGHTVIKRVAITGGYDRDEARWLVSKAMREADRDLAFMEHGSDFREHCEFQSNFWASLPEHVVAQLDSAQAPN